MNDDQRLLAMWCAISGTVYLVLVFVAGILSQNTWAWRFAITTIGINYLAYGLQMHYQGTMLVKIAVLVSIATGAIAGLSLLR